MAMIRTNSLEITPEMLALVGEIDEFKGAWRALGRLAPEQLRQLRTVATIESIGSSTRIEGAKLSDREVEKLLLGAAAQSFKTRDEQEVAGYAAVMEMVFASHDSIPATENHLKQLHAMLLQYSRKDERHRGEYKKHPNHVEAFDAAGRSLGVVFATTSPFDTPGEMEQLFKWFKSAADEGLHPLIAIGVFIVVFLAIHPFQDGNGRLSRVITTLLLLRAGYGYVPYSSLESVIERNKDAYYLALRRTQGALKKKRQDWQPWLLFFMRSLQKQKRNLEIKVEREGAMRGELNKLAGSILDIAAEHGQIRIADVIRMTGAPRGTIKKRIGELMSAGQLQRGGRGRGTWYTLA